MGEPWGTNKTERCVVMSVRGQWFEKDNGQRRGLCVIEGQDFMAVIRF
jgi:hypothetical protein